MTSDERLAVAEEVFEKCRTIMTGKGREYSRGEDDCLSNFKRAGEAIDIDPLKIAFVYMAKHWDSITSFVKTGQTFSEESIEGRYQDLINYAIIHLALIREARTTNVEAMKKDEALFTASLDGAACPVPGTALQVGLPNRFMAAVKEEIQAQEDEARTFLAPRVYPRDRDLVARSRKHAGLPPLS